MKTKAAQSVLIGVAVGDALGVPAEFKPRYYLTAHPIKDITGYGTHSQAPGTWSDDTSLTLCLAESLLKGYDLSDIAQKFVQWHDQAYWTAYDVVFDCGITTGNSIADLRQILAEGDTNRLQQLIFEGNEMSNGNGSLMRIAPLLFYLKGQSIQAQFNIIKEVSALTHRHLRSAIACLIYLQWMERILEGVDKRYAYQATQQKVLSFLKEQQIAERELSLFKPVLEEDIGLYPIDQIKSDGYVVHSLEASIWCLLTTDSYQAAILKAINLGGDTDTTAAITGGLAGLLYGEAAIPEHWKMLLARKQDIMNLADQLAQKYF